MLNDPSRRMSVIDFIVPGKAEPQGSKTRTRWGVREDNPRTMPWRGRVALVAHDYMVAKMLHVLVDVPVAVTLEFVLPRPKTAPKSYTPAAVKKPDVDKLCRAILDGITHIVIATDSQVVRLVADKRIAEIGEEAHARIQVEEQDAPSRRPGRTGSAAITG
jgi:crossover junction endodeoxyribonuclease RusA